MKTILSLALGLAVSSISGAQAQCHSLAARFTALRYVEVSSSVDETHRRQLPSGPTESVMHNYSPYPSLPTEVRIVVEGINGRGRDARIIPTDGSYAATICDSRAVFGIFMYDKPRRSFNQYGLDTRTSNVRPFDAYRMEMIVDGVVQNDYIMWIRDIRHGVSYNSRGIDL